MKQPEEEELFSHVYNNIFYSNIVNKDNSPFHYMLPSFKEAVNMVTMKKIFKNFIKKYLNWLQNVKTNIPQKQLILIIYIYIYIYQIILIVKLIPSIMVVIVTKEKEFIRKLLILF